MIEDSAEGENVPAGQTGVEADEPLEAGWPAGAATGAVAEGPACAAALRVAVGPCLVVTTIVERIEVGERLGSTVRVGV